VTTRIEFVGGPWCGKALEVARLQAEYRVEFSDIGIAHVYAVDNTEARGVRAYHKGTERGVLDSGMDSSW
jgi:hypothetical protein